MKIARVAHEVNKAVCESYGDFSQVEWHQAPTWQKISAINGVMFHLDNPDSTPEQSHDNWCKEKYADGWVHGDVKNEGLKHHPCLVHYDQLPPEQRVKDYVFRQIVNSLTDV